MGPLDVVREQRLLWDSRNLVPVADGCHAQHHARRRPLELERLPDGVFEFASELLGPGRAYNYLRRRYTGPDPRLDALLEASDAAPAAE